MKLLLYLIGLPLLGVCCGGRAACDDLDWPTWRHDNARSGLYPQDLPETLRLQWTYRAPHKPKEAWPGTAQSDWWRKRGTPEPKRVVFDQAYAVVGAGDRLYYGSSTDDQLYCLDLQTGAVLWTYFAEAPIRLAPTVAGDRLLFGSDDGLVHALDRRSGKLLWKATAPDAGRERLPGNGRIISLYPVRSSVMVRGDKAFFCSGLFPKSAGAWHCAVDVASGKLLDRKPISASPQGYLEERDGQLYLPTGRHPAGAFLAKLEASGKSSGRKVPAISRSYPFAFIGTPGQQIGGGDGVVALLSAKDGSERWQARVQGKAKSLAIVRGKLVVSTDEGMIYCFGPERTQPAEATPPRVASTPSPVDPAVEKVLAQLPHQMGYALVLDAAADKGMVLERLTALSGMQVIGLVEDGQVAAILRARLNKLGLYGRAVVHVAPQGGALAYASHIFNLVTSPSGLHGQHPGRGPDHRALLRPGSGAAFFDGPDQPSYRAGALDGTGEWSHMYADAGNTACSNDTRIGSQLRLQWFGRPGPQHIVDRHLRPPPPLVKNGYLFVPGRNYLFGVDAWNGAILWEKEIPDFRRIGALRDSGNLVATDDLLYCATADQCLVLDTMSGEESLRLQLPAGFNRESHEWGYTAVSGSGLVGSAVKKGGVYRTLGYAAIYQAAYGDNTTITCSDCLFAIHRQTGKSFWAYQPKGSILNPSIALSEKEVFFIESHNPESLKKETARLDYPLLLASKGASLVCLELRSGKERWRADLPPDENVQTLFVLYKDRRVIVTNSRNAKAGDAASPTLHYDTRVFDADSGHLAWEKTVDHKRRPNLDHGEQDRHPAIVGDQLIVEPHIYDLRSGKDLGQFKRSGGCGTISASANSLYFRAGNPAAYDLHSHTTGKINNVSRPGCWINMIPAAGLLLVPEGSSGCICKFAIQGSMAFAPK